MGCISHWADYCLAISSVSAPFTIPAFLVDRINFVLNVLCVGHYPYCSTWVPAWPHAPFLQCCVSQLRIPPLIVGQLHYLRSLSLPGDAPLDPSFSASVADFYSLSWVFSNPLPLLIPNQNPPLLSCSPPTIFIPLPFHSPFQVKLKHPCLCLPSCLAPWVCGM